MDIHPIATIPAVSRVSRVAWGQDTHSSRHPVLSNRPRAAHRRMAHRHSHRQSPSVIHTSRRPSLPRRPINRATTLRRSVVHIRIRSQHPPTTPHRRIPAWGPRSRAAQVPRISLTSRQHMAAIILPVYNGHRLPHPSDRANRPGHTPGFLRRRCNHLRHHCVVQIPMARASLRATPMPRQRHTMAIHQHNHQALPPSLPSPQRTVKQLHRRSVLHIPREARTLGAAPDRFPRDRIPMRLHRPRTLWELNPWLNQTHCRRTNSHRCLRCISRKAITSKENGRRTTSRRSEHRGPPPLCSLPDRRPRDGPTRWPAILNHGLYPDLRRTGRRGRGSAPGLRMAPGTCPKDSTENGPLLIRARFRGRGGTVREHLE